MARANSGMDPSPLLPLGVLAIVVLIVATPVAFQVVPVVRETASQTLSLFWAIPLIIVAALFLTSSEMLVPTSNYYDRRPMYRTSHYRSSEHGYGGEGPSWGLLGLMLLMLLLLPWRH